MACIFVVSYNNANDGSSFGDCDFSVMDEMIQ
jgi:hypothetical protein